ncbi:MAG: c-type cytochrome [Candidatus Competibacter denitrificans]
MTTSVTLISGLVLLAVVLFMAAALISVVGHVAPDDNSRRQAAALERIKPVARVSFEQPKPAVAVKLSGAEVYNKVCAACHAAGTLGAPKVGDKAQWETRLAQGLDTLVTHSVSGLRAMPAKGGDPSLTDANLKDAIGYMLDQTGIKTEASATAPAPAAAAPAPAAAAPAPAAAAPAPAPTVTAAPAKPTAAVAPPPAQPAVTAAPAKTATAPVIPPPPIQVPKATPPAFIQGAPVPAK